ncbi:MAG: hypothetical protein DLM73_05325 [Chthoniobacterales bacterium]|nr:MAG: hypothetical protein DLM73_05325 [Chthoniobacterales bacterium]
MKLKSSSLSVLCSTLSALLVTTSISAAGGATVTLYNTGVNNAGVALPALSSDPHWTVVTPSGQGPGPFVNNFGGWIAPPASANWISPFTNQFADGPEGNYVYSTTFNVANADLGNVTITGQVAVDNIGSIQLNGSSNGITLSDQPNFAHYATFTISPTANFVAGPNTFSALVTNTAGSGANPTGAIVVFTSGVNTNSPPPHGGLSATIFTVNGSSSPSSNVADTVLRFAAQQSGTPADLIVRVQATTTPGTESSWADLTNGNNGRMTLDPAAFQFVLNSSDYPLQNGVSFRAISTASGYPDSISNVVGPFNLISAKSHLGTTALSITANGTIADLYFRATESTVPAGISVRIQSTTTPADQASWADLNDGNSGYMQQSTNPNQFLLLLNKYPAGQGLYFRAVASLSGFVDSISNPSGPFNLVADTPPVVTVQPPTGLAGSGDGHDLDHPILVQEGFFTFGASAQSDRSIKSLALQMDGETLRSFLNGETNGSVVTINVIGDHVLEAIAVDDLGATARAGTGAIYLRVIPANSALKAERAGSDRSAAAQSSPKVYNAVSDGSWTDPTTWIDQHGNNGVPTADDFVTIGSHTIYFAGINDAFAKSLTISGGKLFALDGVLLHISGELTINACTVVANLAFVVENGAFCNFLNASDIQFTSDSDPHNQGTGFIVNKGTLNIHGSGGVLGASQLVNLGTINWLPPLQIPPNAAVDPAAAVRLIDAISVSNFGLTTGITSSLLTSDGASLITSDGASVISQGGGNVISQGGGNVISQGGGNVISQGGGNILSHDGATVIATGGGNLIGIKGGSAAGATSAHAATAPSGYIQTGGETNLTSFNIVGPVTLNGGVLTGSGLIQGDLTNNGGYISPGHSPGLLGVTGNFTQGANGTLVLEKGGKFPSQFDQLQVGGAANLGGKLDLKMINGYTPDAADTFSPLAYRSASGSFSSVSSNAQVTVNATGLLTTVNPNVASPKSGQPLNIATRLAIQSGDNVLIAGFIVTGPSGSTKKVLIRGLGPSLAGLGVPGTISDPLLELHNPDGSVVINDNWQQGDTSQIPAGFAPSDPRESVVVATLGPGNYTAILKGAHGETGVGLAEVYDLDSASAAQLGNIATRGFVNTGDNVLIGGFIIGGTEPAKVVVRAIAPSLASILPGVLKATTLELHDANGSVISNEGWRNTQESEILATQLQPANDNEAAILATLVPGNYTAIVRGKDDTTGIAVVEAYNLQ